MLRTILSRLGRALSVGFWVMVISFSIMRIIPGDPAAARLGGVEQDAIEVLRKELNLDGSIMQQFSTYIVGLLKGDLGVSLQTGRSVTDIIGSTLPLTVYLIIFSTFFAFVLSIPLGTAIAWSGRASIVYSFRVITSIILAIPNFFIAMIGILIFTVRVNWSPVFGYEPQFPQNLKYLWLPVLVKTIIMISVISRVLFSSVVETKEEEFVETGIIRGVGRRKFFWFYILKPSLAPTVVLLSYMMGAMLGATVILETIFTLPGIGRELVNAVLTSDYPVVQGILLIFGVLTVLLSFIGDIVAYVLDRRVKI
jgi:ABC-type dipeptide/oligopeptide/nickel transport system permease component